MADGGVDIDLYADDIESDFNRQVCRNGIKILPYFSQLRGDHLLVWLKYLSCIFCVDYCDKDGRLRRLSGWVWRWERGFVWRRDRRAGIEAWRRRRPAELRIIATRTWGDQRQRSLSQRPQPRTSWPPLPTLRRQPDLGSYMILFYLVCNVNIESVFVLVSVFTLEWVKTRFLK